MPCVRSHTRSATSSIVSSAAGGDRPGRLRPARRLVAAYPRESAADECGRREAPSSRASPVGDRAGGQEGEPDARLSLFALDQQGERDRRSREAGQGKRDSRSARKRGSPAAGSGSDCRCAQADEREEDVDRVERLPGALAREPIDKKEQKQ